MRRAWLTVLTVASHPGLALRVALNPPWLCRFVGHDLIPRLPFCWRCHEHWPEWSDAIAAATP